MTKYETQTFAEILEDKNIFLKKILDKYKRFGNIELITKLKKEIEFLEEIVNIENQLLHIDEYVCYKRIKQLNELMEKHKNEPVIYQKLCHEAFEIHRKRIHKSILKPKLEFIKRIRKTIQIFENSKIPPIETINKLYNFIDTYKDKNNIFSEEIEDYILSSKLNIDLKGSTSLIR